ncbi:MAG: 2-hydroxyglutaryl-CoA dehydratase, partial [Oscillospiraceae bacterium]
NSIIEDFSKIAIKKEPKVKVGIVGEIYVKYSPLANNDLEKFLASQDCEVCVPGVMAFMLYMTDNIIIDTDLYGGNVFIYHAMKILKKYFSSIEKKMLKVYENYSNFSAPTPFEETKKMVDGVIGYGTKMGEGWLLTAEMLELAHTGYENIICAQPFGCLPNHIVGRGMIRKIREKCPNANIVAVDYDPGAKKVNQENRIKLMLAVGKENLQNYEISIKNESIKYTQTTK